MEFLKKLWDKIKNEDNKKNDVKNINSIKIEDNDNKTNKNKSTDAIKNEFDGLASQINGFLSKFYESQNNANANLLGIIENLYAIHNNLIKKIESLGIITKLWEKKFEDIKEEYEGNTKWIQYEIKKGALATISNNFEELKDIIANLNVQQLKNINIEFKSGLDKNKNKEIENMREKILDSLENLCNVINNELTQFFENIFLKKQAIEKKEKEEQKKKLEEEKRKRLEEEERRKKEEEMKKVEEYERKEKEKQKMKEEEELSGLIDKFLEKYPSDFDYKDATDDFYSIFKGIMKLCGGHTENILSNDFLEWNVEFDDNAKLSEKSADKLKNLCEHMSQVYYNKKNTNFLYENLKNNIKKFFDKDGANFGELKKYFKNCHLNPKKTEQKLQQEEKNEALQEVKKLLLKNGISKDNIKKYQNKCENIKKTEFESNEEISETLKNYCYIYSELYKFLSLIDSEVVGEKLNVNLNNDELNYKFECLNKLKEWFEMILDKISSKDESLQDIKKLFEKGNLKKLFKNLYNKNFSIEKIKASKLKIKEKNIKKLKVNFLKNAKEKIVTLTGRYQVFTAQNIINFFNEYYKYYSDLYDIYECLPTKKELDAKIEYTNIGADLTSGNCQIPLIKQTIKDISNNIPKFREIREWFGRISNPKNNNYRGRIDEIFKDIEDIEDREDRKDRKDRKDRMDRMVGAFLFILKGQKLPTKEDVERIKEQFPYIKNWID